MKSNVRSLEKRRKEKKMASLNGCFLNYDPLTLKQKKGERSLSLLPAQLFSRPN